MWAGTTSTVMRSMRDATNPIPMQRAHSLTRKPPGSSLILHRAVHGSDDGLIDGGMLILNVAIGDCPMATAIQSEWSLSIPSCELIQVNAILQVTSLSVIVDRGVVLLLRCVIQEVS